MERNFSKLKDGGVCVIKRIGIILLITSSLFAITGCKMEKTGVKNQIKETIDYYPSIDEAIQEGLKAEDGKNKDILGSVSIDDETVIAFISDHKFGYANISEKDGLYAWNRAKPRMGVQYTGDETVIITKTEETEEGKEYELKIGYVDPRNDYKTAKVNINNDIKNLEIHESGYYFYMAKRIQKFSLIELLE